MTLKSHEKLADILFSLRRIERDNFIETEQVFFEEAFNQLNALQKSICKRGV